MCGVGSQPKTFASNMKRVFKMNFEAVHHKREDGVIDPYVIRLTKCCMQPYSKPNKQLKKSHLVLGEWN